MSIKHSQNFGIVGSTQFDDTRFVGTGSKISRITVSDGAVIDRLSITYQTSGGSQTFNHGGEGGTPVTFDIGENEVIVGVYGTFGPVSPNEYGPSNISTLRFVIHDKNTGNVRVQGPFGQSAAPHIFSMTGEIVAFAGSHDNLLRGISFYYRSN